MHRAIRASASLLALALTATLAAAQGVRSPPLPIGSQKVRVEPGMQEVERKRPQRKAGKGAARQHRDFNQDDRDWSRPDSADVETAAERAARSPSSGKAK